MRYFLSILLLISIGIASSAQATVTNTVGKGQWLNVGFGIDDGCSFVLGGLIVTETSLRNRNDVEPSPSDLNFVYLQTYNWCSGQIQYGYAYGNIEVSTLNFDDPVRAAQLDATFEMDFWEGDAENPQNARRETVSLQVSLTGEGQLVNSREKITHSSPLLGRISWSSHGAWRTAAAQATMSSPSLLLTTDRGDWHGKLGDSMTHELMVYRPK